MSRRFKLKKKKNNCDKFYNCEKINKIINIMMKNGKKRKSEKIFYKCMSYIRKTYKKNPYEIFCQCIKNSIPMTILKKKKIGGTRFNIPVKLSISKGIFYALKNIILVTKKKQGKFYENLGKEIYDTYRGNSLSVKIRDDIHKLSEANRAFSHFIY
ncbi:hypothetical protein ACWNYO_00045 [Candidatus Vidania fulgoroideorum]